MSSSPAGAGPSSSAGPFHLQISINGSAVAQNGSRSWTVVSYLHHTVCTHTMCTFYEEHRVLHINRVESACSVRGLGREVFVRILHFLSERLGFPCIYLFSSPVPVCYLKRKEAPFDTRMLLEFWKSVLVDAGYAPKPLGHAEIRTGLAEDLLVPRKELVRCIPKMEDDPLSRIIKHMKSPRKEPQEMEISVQTLRDALAILSGSRDISRGTIVLADPVPNKLNASPGLTGMPVDSLVSVEAPVEHERAGAVNIKGNIRIRPEEVRKRPIQEIIRMRSEGHKRKHKE